jgi:hypothetical protein
VLPTNARVEASPLVERRNRKNRKQMSAERNCPSSRRAFNM